MHGCKAVVIGTEHHCDSCNLVWDINDDDPPKCRQHLVDGKKVLIDLIKKVKK